jgi:hypothetical protein
VTDWAVLEVAIGLIFIYMILSFLCSGLNETVSSLFAWRASMLEEGIRNLLNDPKGEGLSKRIYDHPLIRGLSRPSTASKVDTQGIRRLPGMRKLTAWTRRERYPSYIPSRAFTVALLDGMEEAPDKVEAAIRGLGNPEVETALLAVFRDAEGDFNRFKTGVEGWYDNAMARVSGWYRRRVQLFIWIWAITTAVVLNADTLQIVDRLWTERTVRAAVVAQAQAPGQTAREDLEQVADEVGALASLDVPLGWDFSNGGDQDTPGDVLGWIAKIIGLLLTGAALSLGAPFWFDLLGKIARVRSSGARPNLSTAVSAEAQPASREPPRTQR